MNITKIKVDIKVIVENDLSVSEKLQTICNYLKNEIDYYDWVGFYFNNGNKQELKLAEFAGEPTEHKIIPFGKGICGQAAISNKNFIIADVSAQNNYISCGLNVKSEIVIPVFVNKKNIGQIDIDSHTLNAFTKKDEMLLEFVCEKVADLF